MKFQMQKKKKKKTKYYRLSELGYGTDNGGNMRK